MKHLLSCLLACAVFLAGCTRDDLGGSPSAPDAEQRLVQAKADAAAAHVREMAAAKDLETAKAAATVAPLTAILHVAEGLAVTAIILGVVEIVLSMILTSLPIGKLLGEAMIGSGAATLLTCGLLQGALNHAHLILCWSAAALIIWGVVWLKRTHKLAAVLGVAHDSYALAISALRSIGRHAEADAIEAGHALKVAEHDAAAWVKSLLARLHIIKISIPPAPPVIITPTMAPIVAPAKPPTTITTP